MGSAVNGLSLYFLAPHEVEVRREHVPEPAWGEVLVETHVSAISAGTEMLLYRGEAPAEMAVDETIVALEGAFRYPLKYGYATVGRVAALGPGVNKAWQDRLVFAFQPHQSHFAARPEALLPVPDGIPPETAVLLPNVETAVSFLMDGQPIIGEQVVVFGQGVVGLLTSMLLAELPLTCLVTLDRYALRREWSTRLGAHVALDPAAPGSLDTLRQTLQGTGDYVGADLVYELSGQPAALQQAIEVVGYNGRILVGSWYGQKQAALNLGGRFHRSHARIISSQVSHLAPQWSGRWTKARRLQVAWDVLARRQPGALITHRFPIARAAEAYRLLDQQPEQAIQVILTYGGQ